jgi:hypothetical protein
LDDLEIRRKGLFEDRLPKHRPVWDYTSKEDHDDVVFMYLTEFNAQFLK